MKIHFFVPHGITPTAQQMIVALAGSCAAAGDRPHVTRGGVPSIDGDVLVTYGAGGQLQSAAMRQYRSNGLRTVSLDLGYWNRSLSGPDRCFRFSVDGAHPTHEHVTAATPCTHYTTTRRVGEIVNSYDPRGHVVFAKLGKKSTLAYAHAVRGEGVLLYKAVQAFGTSLVVREKKAPPPHPPIESLLVGCAGVVTYSSNATLDAACRRVPFHCVEGVASPFSSPLDNMRQLPRDTAEAIIRKAGAFHVTREMCRTAEAWKRVKEIMR